RVGGDLEQVAARRNAGDRFLRRLYLHARELLGELFHQRVGSTLLARGAGRALPRTANGLRARGDDVAAKERRRVARGLAPAAHERVLTQVGPATPQLQLDVLTRRRGGRDFVVRVKRGHASGVKRVHEVASFDAQRRERR